MKLRLEPGSIRIRLSEQDINIWKEKDILKESLELGNNLAISWELRKEQGMEALRVDISQCALSISVPYGATEQWLNSGETGLGEFLDVDGHGALRIVVERDMKPKMPRHER